MIQKKKVQILLREKKPPDCLVFQNPLSDDMLITEKSNSSEIPVHPCPIEDIISTISSPNNLLYQNPSSVIDNDSLTVEFQHQVNEMISTGKFNISKIDSLTTKLLGTLDPVLISNGEDLKPFWTTPLKDKSKNLWLPTKIDLLDSDLIFSNTCSKNFQMPQSWFLNKKTIPLNMKWSKTSLVSLMSSQQKQMDLENIKNKSTMNSNIQIRTRKLRMKPNLQQRKILNNWFGVYRWFYNRTIDLAEKIKVYSDIKLKKQLRNDQTRKFDLPDWVNDKIPSRIITGAIQDCCKAYKSAFANIKAQNISQFKIQNKTKKNPNQTLVVEKDCIGQNNQIFSTFLKHTGPIRVEDLKERNKQRKKKGKKPERFCTRI